MSRSTRWIPCAMAIAFTAACGDFPTPPDTPPIMFRTYVSLGTSLSMGWMNDGVFGATQQMAWPSRLAGAATANFELPLIAAPGCQPPYASPLGSFKRVDGTPITASSVCSPLEAGVSLATTNNVAIEGAYASDALTATPNAPRAGKGPITSRVLEPTMTQVSTMLARSPTFVSVEFGGNELLQAQVGLLVPNVTYVPFAAFQEAYGKIIDSVKATGARALLVGLALDMRQFPAIRTGPELWSQRAAFAGFNVTVAANCETSPNFMFIRGIVPTAIATGAGRAAAGLGPATLSCADVPGQVDYVLTPADIQFLNSLAAQMDAEIQSLALQNRYAFFRLEVLYAPSKDEVPFSLAAYLGSATPYGPAISLDGVHPNSTGQTILANAAISAINEAYKTRMAPVN
jgi:lysophospholipase L1-like esterase